MSRVESLRQAATSGVRLILGVTALLLLAAFIEAFWSSTQSIPGWIKFSVSGVLWTLVFAWLWFGGRNQPGDTDAP